MTKRKLAFQSVYERPIARHLNNLDNTPKQKVYFLHHNRVSFYVLLENHGIMDGKWIEERYLVCLFLLEQEDAVHQSFCGRWASRDVNVDRNDSIASSNDRVRVVVVPASIGATSHRDDPSRFRHLIVDLSQRRSHFIRQRSSDNHHITLSWRSTENDSESILIVSGCRDVHHLDCATSQTECHWPDGSLTGPIHNSIGARENIIHRVFGSLL